MWNMEFNSVSAGSLLAICMLSSIDAPAGSIDGTNVLWHAEQEHDSSSSEYDPHGDQFGCSAALDGNVAIVGAQFNDLNRRGNAYIFEETVPGQWNRTSLIELMPELQKYLQAGNAVDIIDNEQLGCFAIVGATGHDNHAFVNEDGNYTVSQSRWIYSGRAYLFQRMCTDGDCNWIFRQVFGPGDPPGGSEEYELPRDNFGFSVSLSADEAGSNIHALVGANRADGFRGSAHLITYSSDGSSSTNVLLPPGTAGMMNFGTSVCLSGNKAIIGSDWASNYHGRAYIYECTSANWDCLEDGGFIEPVVLAAGSGTEQYDFFGSSTCISGNTAAVGAPGANSSAGRAFVFERQETPEGNINWARTELIPSIPGSDPSPRDRLGSSISISDDETLISIGVPGRDECRGAVYLFSRTSGEWIHHATLTAPASHASRYDFFGNAASLSDGRILVGAKLYDAQGKENDNVGGDGVPENFLFLNAGCTFLMDAAGEYEPTCSADLSGSTKSPDGMVDVLDLLVVLEQWGECNGCTADFTGPGGIPDGVVDVNELLGVIAQWGKCL